MNLPLLELAQNYFLGSSGRQTSTAFSESESSVRAGLQSMVPLVLGGLLVHAQRPGGAAELTTLAQQLHGRGLLGDLSELLAGLQRSRAPETDRGAEMMHGLLGSDYPAVAASIGQQAGLRPESVHKLLSVVVAVVLSLLGRHAAQQNLGAAGLASYLESQRASIRQAVSSLPREVSSPLLDLLSDSPRTTAKIVARASAISDIAGRPAALVPAEAPLPIEPHATSPEPAPPQEVIRPAPLAGGSEPAPGGAQPGSQSAAGASERPVSRPARAAARPRWLWLLAVLGLAVLGYFGGKFVKQRSVGHADAVNAPRPVAVDTPVNTPVTGYYEVATNKYYYDLGPAVRLQLPTGRTLQVGANSTEAQLFYLLTGSAKARPDTAQAGICLDRVSFDTGTATLTAASLAQVTNLVALLQAYPTAQLKVGGFTDSQGRAEANLLRSADRANAVRNALLRQAIAPSRIAAQGYGQSHPLASNDTRAGRAQNRRVAILLLKSK